MRVLTCALLWLCISVVPASAKRVGEKQADQSPVDRLPFNYHSGPTTANFGDQATVRVPEGMVWVDQANTEAFLRYTHNIPSGNELGIIFASDLSWFVEFSFDSIGLVRDDEKDSIDADELIKEIRQGTDAANTQLTAKGWSTLSILGWKVPPRYEPDTHNLEWCIEARSSSGEQVLNHDVRLLGRLGVMKARLVADPLHYVSDLKSFRQLTEGFRFNKGNEYSAWIKGDKVAEYGLTALIVGGGAAAVAKTGILKSLAKMLIVAWKLVVAGVVGLFSVLKRLFNRQKEAPTAIAESRGESVDG